MNTLIDETRQLYKSLYNSPIGKIKIIAEDNVITRVCFTDNLETIEKPNRATLKCKKQLEEYFAGKRKKFDVTYKLEGTEFQCAVWRELEKVQYGEKVTYKDIALKMKKLAAVRAVANAIGKNKLLILIPCHRVIGSNGKLTGFSAKTEEKTGLELKKELLDLEEKQNNSRNEKV